MKAVVIVDSPKCRITLYVVGWIIIHTVCLCCLKPGVPVLDKHVFGRLDDKRSLYISSKREKLSSLWIHEVYLQHPFYACCLSTALFHNNYMIVLGNEHMAVDWLSSSALGHWIFSEGFRPVICSHHNCPIGLWDSWRRERRISSHRLKYKQTDL